jgi:hypothetical protein
MDVRWAAVTCLLAITPVGSAQECPTQIGGLPFGEVVEVVSSDGLVYFAVGDTVRVLDVSMPAGPVPAGQVLLLSGVGDLAISGAHLFLTTCPRADCSLLVFDVSDPSHPIELGSCALGSAGGIAVSGGLAYVTSDASLVVIDLSDPSAPVEIGSATTPLPAYDVALAGSHAFVVGDEYNLSTGVYDGYLSVVDVSDPAEPAAIATYPWTGSSVGGVGVAGDHVFVTADPAGLRVVNVSIPGAPVEVGSYPVIGEGVTPVGSHLLVGAGASGLRILDVSVPSQPQEVGFVDTPGHAHQSTVTGSLAAVADGGGGLRLIDITDLAAPFEVGAEETTSSTSCNVTARGSQVFATTQHDGLRVLDFSDPAMPVEIGSWQTPDGSYEVVVRGEYAYVACGDYLAPHGALRVIDISDPTSPSQAGFWLAPGGEAVGVALQDDLALVVTDELNVIDISVPASPVAIGSIPTPGQARAVAVAGNHAFIADGYEGLMVVDISTPSTPLAVGSLALPAFSHDVAIAGDHALVAASWGGLRIIDISVPSVPVEVGFFQTSYEAYNVAVRGHLALLAVGSDVLQVVDISNPSSPVEIGAIDTPSHSDVAAWDDRALVAADGVRAFDLRGCLDPIFADGFEPGSTIAWSLTVP